MLKFVGRVLNGFVMAKNKVLLKAIHIDVFFVFQQHSNTHWYCPPAVICDLLYNNETVLTPIRYFPQYPVDLDRNCV